jgi:hypothetical protein
MKDKKDTQDGDKPKDGAKVCWHFCLMHVLHFCLYFFILFFYICHFTIFLFIVLSMFKMLDRSIVVDARFLFVCMHYFFFLGYDMPWGLKLSFFLPANLHVVEFKHSVLTRLSFVLTDFVREKKDSDVVSTDTIAEMSPSVLLSYFIPDAITCFFHVQLESSFFLCCSRLWTLLQQLTSFFTLHMYNARL